MASKPGRRKRCGASSRRNNGAPCQNFAVTGRERCRFHGGTQPIGAASSSATHRLKGGLFAKAFNDAEKAAFAEVFGDMMADPTIAMMADAALMRVKAATALARADAAGMLTVRQGAVKKTEPAFHDDGRPVMYRGDDGTMKPVLRTSETVSAERVDIMGPLSELLMKSARLAEGSVMLKKRAGIIGEDEVSALDESTAAEILRREFADTGALHQEDDDGPVGHNGAARAKPGG